MAKFQPTIFAKGLVLISVPLLFELAFGLTVIYLQHDYEQKLAEQVRANAIIAHANEMWLSCMDVVANRLYNKVVPGFSNHDRIEEPHLKEEYLKLWNLLQKEPDMIVLLDQVKQAADNVMAAPGNFEESSGGVFGQLAALRGNMKSFVFLQKNMHTLGQRIRAFRDPWREKSEKAAAAVGSAKVLILAVSVGGIAISIIIAGLLLAYFMRGIYGGIEVLMRNTQRLAESQPLLPLLGGNDELSKLDATFHNMVASMKQMEQTKQDFFNMVSHDMRTPLSSIMISLEALATGVYPGVPEIVMQTVSRARQNAMHLVRLINDLLDIEKLEHGAVELDLQQTALADVCAEAIEVVHPLAQNKGIKIAKPDANVDVPADSSRILRVMVNLIANAIKFSPKESSIEIQINPDGKFVEVSVQDHGPGISPEAQALVFDRYKQVSMDSALRKGGTGLGLAISKAFIEAHGGQIGLESKVGEGSRFWFRLPRQDEGIN